jgi:hypothetical protein
MSAASPSTEPVRIVFEATAEFRRQLVVSSKYEFGSVWVEIYEPTSKSNRFRLQRQLAFAMAHHGRCRIERKNISGEYELWIDSAAFDVSAHEANEIAKKFSIEVRA